MARISLNEASIEEMINDPGGDVALMVESLVAQAAGAARASVPVRTGATLASIRTEMHYGSHDPWGDVHGSPWGEVSSAYATSFLEHGVRPHWIWSHGSWSMRTAMDEYLGHLVLHPGIAPRPFMSTALWSVQLAA